MISFSRFTNDQLFLIAWIGAALTSVYSLVLTLAPHKEGEIYSKQKIEYKNEAEEELIRSIVSQSNLAILTCQLIFWSINYKNLDSEVAIGVACIPWFTLTLYFVLNDVPRRVGNSVKGVYTNLALFGFVAYSTIMETEYSTVSVKVLAATCLAHGLSLLFAPTYHAFVWGNVEGTTLLQLNRRCAGCNLSVLAVYLCAVIGDAPPLFACGLSWGAAFVGILLLVNDFKKLNRDMRKVYTWLVVSAFYAIILTASVPIDQDLAAEQPDKQ